MENGDGDEDMDIREREAEVKDKADDDNSVFSDALSGDESSEDETDETDGKKRKRDQSLHDVSKDGDAESEIQMLRRDMKNVKSKMKSLIQEVEKMSRVMEKLEAQEAKLLKVGKEVKSVESVVKEVEKDVKKIDKVVKEQTADMKKEVDSYSDRILSIEEKCIDAEGRSRRNNAIFHGQAEVEGEDCMALVRKIIHDDCKVAKTVIIERAHRIGKSRRGMIGRNAQRPRPLIVRFLSYTDKQLVKKAARDNLPDDKACRDDLPYAVRQARKKLSVQYEAARRDTTVSDVYISYPAKLFVDSVLVTSINPATCEPYANRAQVPQRPHIDTDRREGDDEFTPVRRDARRSYAQRARGDEQYRGYQRGRGGFDHGRRGHFRDGRRGGAYA